jgi:hypothetical protein
MRTLRKGMWIKRGGDVGILMTTQAGGFEMHVVAPNGTTAAIIPVTPEQFSIAAYADIPESRRPPEDIGRMFGYL